MSAEKPRTLATESFRRSARIIIGPPYFFESGDGPSRESQLRPSQNGPPTRCAQAPPTRTPAVGSGWVGPMSTGTLTSNPAVRADRLHDSRRLGPARGRRWGRGSPSGADSSGRASAVLDGAGGSGSGPRASSVASRGRWRSAPGHLVLSTSEDSTTTSAPSVGAG